ncbi:MAG: hypothetical protein MZW92_76410 [Comamonadaceae bacterium]|nr:hypothetical protein [Comamonadaceae bacterium]
MTLTESFAMLPGGGGERLLLRAPARRATSRSAKIGRDQVEDYARRKGMALADGRALAGAGSGVGGIMLASFVLAAAVAAAHPAAPAIEPVTGRSAAGRADRRGLRLHLLFRTAAGCGEGDPALERGRPRPRHDEARRRSA